MLNSIRNFSKTIFAKILLVIVVIPFVFWGMGGVFSSGNTNSLAKIDNINISTQEFIEHINDLNINQEAIRENLDNEIVEELLSELISKKILEIQINELDINITEKNLANIIKKNPNVFDDNNNLMLLSRNHIEQHLDKDDDDFDHKLSTNLFNTSLRKQAKQTKKLKDEQEINKYKKAVKEKRQKQIEQIRKQR